MKTRIIRDRIEKNLRSCGYLCETSASSISESQYIWVSHPAANESHTVRVSEHMPSTKYDRPDIDVGPHARYSMEEYPEVCAMICDLDGVSMSPTLRRILTRRKNAAQLAAQKRAEMETIRAEKASARIASARPIYAAHRAEIDAQAAHIETLSGQPRRRARSKFNQRWGEFAYELRLLAKENQPI